MEGAKVAVAVRIRPILAKGGSAMHQQERFEPLSARRLGDNQIQMVEQRADEATTRSSTFVFDHVFDHDATQLDVYEEAVVDLIDAALIGRNATILAYGQTGSGKTHTMLGDVRPNPLEADLLTNESGVFLRVLADLMEYKVRRAADVHIVVGLSCVEIYNDKIRDLFGGSSATETPPTIKPKMTDDFVHLPNLIVKEVTSLNSVFAELQLAISRRQSRATDSNASSSRSHCLFMIDVLQQSATAPPPPLTLVTDPPRTSRSPPPTGTAREGWMGSVLSAPDHSEPVYASKILLADLAGSEKIRNSGVTGEGMAEATAINSSLTALGNVVHALHDGSLPSYRTSSLTRLLKPAFSQPSSRVLLLSQVAPTQLTFDESVSTMHFANKVKAMKVTTMRGVEADRLQFDYFDAAKLRDELQADLHIWSVEAVARPWMRRRGVGLQDRVFRCIAAPPRGAKEMMADIKARGVLEKGAEEKRRLEQEAVARTQREASEMAQEAKLRVKDAVAEHKEGLSTASKELRLSAEEQAGHALQCHEMEQVVRREALKEAEDAAWEDLITGAFSVLADRLRKEASAARVGLAKLQQVPAPLSKNADVESAMLDDDKKFAASCFAHCAGRRILNDLIALRSAQEAQLTLRCNALRMEAWAKEQSQ